MVVSTAAMPGYPPDLVMQVGSETFDCSSLTVERFPLMLLASNADRSDFVDLDVSAAAWIGLIVLIVVMLAIDLYKHREAHEPTSREALVESQHLDRLRARLRWRHRSGVRRRRVR